MILGIIADDFTGATDVASMLVRQGMRTAVHLGLPSSSPDASNIRDVQALVIALKSRTSPVQQAVADSLTACHWLKRAGAKQMYFKYCSTFDSTSEGNIGPVTQALMVALNTNSAIVCPAFPENGRTVYNGHLFVGDALLSESSMRHHPLTPMTDSNLVRVLQRQTSHRVGSVRQSVVTKGSAALQAALQDTLERGEGMVVVDAINDADLYTIASACVDAALITAGSGVALGLPAAYAQRGWLEPDSQSAHLPPVGGYQAVLSGSCSAATRAQVADWKARGLPAYALNPLHAITAEQAAHEMFQLWQRHPKAPSLFYATAEPDMVQAAQSQRGLVQASQWVEQGLAGLARKLVQNGVKRLLVAGGETSGAVVQALQVSELRIGPTIAPGVPWTYVPDRNLLLALKSGNFGGPAFFQQALDMTT